MRTEQTEKRLAAELAAETPDVLANILLCCTPEAQRRVMPIAAAKRPAGRKWVKALYAGGTCRILPVKAFSAPRSASSPGYAQPKAKALPCASCVSVAQPKAISAIYVFSLSCK